MASRKDELRAHQFLRQRVVSALVVHETDPEHPPFRRPTLATYWGLALALLGLAVAGVLGLFNHDDPVHLEPGKTVIVEGGTGARFVYLDGLLHPVANYASALLSLGSHAPTQTVSAGDLLGVARGAQIGISGAPDDLPDAGRLLPGAWSMCSRPVTDDAGTRVVQSVLLVGTTPPGAAAAGRAVLVASDGHEYLIWNGYRHEIIDRDVVTAGLGMASEAALPVSRAWLDVLPAGADIAPLDVPGAGRPSTALGPRPGVRAGQLFVVTVSPAVSQYYLAQTDSLVPLNPFQLAIQLAGRATTHAYGTATPRPIPLDSAEVTLADQPHAPPDASDPPRTRPSFVAAGDAAAVCSVFPPGDAVPRIMVRARLSAGEGTLATGGAGPTGTPLADLVAVPAGRAALISVVPGPRAITGTLALVTDAGRLYPLASADVVAMLGYDGVTPVRVAAGVAVRLPVGPALDPAAARTPR